MRSEASQTAVFRVECERSGEVKLAGNRKPMFSAPAHPLHPMFSGLRGRFGVKNEIRPDRAGKTPPPLPLGGDVVGVLRFRGSPPPRAAPGAGLPQAARPAPSGGAAGRVREVEDKAAAWSWRGEPCNAAKVPGRERPLQPCQVQGPPMKDVRRVLTAPEPGRMAKVPGATAFRLP